MSGTRQILTPARLCSHSARSMRVTSKGQVTIPRHVRALLGITPGSQIDFQVDEHGARLIRVSPGGGMDTAAAMRGPRDGRDEHRGDHGAHAARPDRLCRARASTATSRSAASPTIRRGRHGRRPLWPRRSSPNPSPSTRSSAPRSPSRLTASERWTSRWGPRSNASRSHGRRRSWSRLIPRIPPACRPHGCRCEYRHSVSSGGAHAAAQATVVQNASQTSVSNHSSRHGGPVVRSPASRALRVCSGSHSCRRQATFRCDQPSRRGCLAREIQLLTRPVS